MRLMMYSVLTCTQRVVGSSGAIQVEYSKGGRPYVFALEKLMHETGLCGYSGSNTSTLTGTGGSSSSSSGAAATLPILRGWLSIASVSSILLGSLSYLLL